MKDAETILAEIQPSMFRNMPLLFCVVVLLCFLLVGIPILLIWWLMCKATKLTVTNKRSTLRRGLLSKSTTDVWHRDVRNVQITQSLQHRLFGVGTIGISSSGQSGMEIQVSGIPGPERIKKLIDEHRTG